MLYFHNNFSIKNYCHLKYMKLVHGNTIFSFREYLTDDLNLSAIGTNYY